VVEKRDQNDDRDRNAEKPKQNSTAQFTLLNVAFTRIVSGRSTLRRLNLFQVETAHSAIAYLLAAVSGRPIGEERTHLERFAGQSRAWNVGSVLPGLISPKLQPAARL
jgi:hypothetical protein